jgi:hypothetical protein
MNGEQSKTWCYWFGIILNAIFWLVTLAGVLLIGAMCLSGCTSAPTAFESRFFTITTNDVPTITVHTNEFYRTNVVVNNVYTTNMVDDVAAGLTQGIEVLSEVLKTTPQGNVLDEKVKAWLQANQLQTGTALEVVRLLSTVVDNEAAREVAAKIQAEIAARTK